MGFIGELMRLLFENAQGELPEKIFKQPPRLRPSRRIVNKPHSVQGLV